MPRGASRVQCCSSNGALQEDRAIDRRHIRRLAQIAEKYKQKTKEKATTKVLKHEVCVKAEAAVVGVGVVGVGRRADRDVTGDRGR